MSEPKRLLLTAEPLFVLHSASRGAWIELRRSGSYNMEYAATINETSARGMSLCAAADLMERFNEVRLCGCKDWSIREAPEICDCPRRCDYKTRRTYGNPYNPYPLPDDKEEE